MALRTLEHPDHEKISQISVVEQGERRVISPDEKEYQQKVQDMLSFFGAKTPVIVEFVNKDGDDVVRKETSIDRWGEDQGTLVVYLKGNPQPLPLKQVVFDHTQGALFIENNGRAIRLALDYSTLESIEQILTITKETRAKIEKTLARRKVLTPGTDTTGLAGFFGSNSGVDQSLNSYTGSGAQIEEKWDTIQMVREAVPGAQNIEYTVAKENNRTAKRIREYWEHPDVPDYRRMNVYIVENESIKEVPFSEESMILEHRQIQETLRQFSAGQAVNVSVQSDPQGKNTQVKEWKKEEGKLSLYFTNNPVPFVVEAAIINPDTQEMVLKTDSDTIKVKRR